MIPILNVFYSVGDFILDSNINDYLEKFSFEINDFSSDLHVPGVHYSLDCPEITLYVHNNLIECIGCYSELLYKGCNLIGLTINEFISQIGENYCGEVDCLNFEDDDIPQYVYEFESIGLQVWVKGFNGKIVSIIVSTH